MFNPLVSIIIPTYNRADLIGNTLDSILAQTYTNWECIVVDDGSTDDTEIVVMDYVKSDARFQYHKRPETKIKGANACRNFGFEISKGELVNWFDSDDLMLDVALQSKLDAFDDSIDFVIGNSLNFDEEGTISRPYELNYNIPITAENFINQTIGWITNDVLVKREVVKISFNEQLKSGQEYNFFARLLFVTDNGKYLKKDVSKRRIHKGSIAYELEVSKDKNLMYLHNDLILFNDIKSYSSEKLKNRFLKRIIRFSVHTTNKFELPKFRLEVLRFLFQLGSLKTIFFYCIWMLLNLIFGKGYWLVKKMI